MAAPLFICINSSEGHPRTAELLPLRHPLSSIAYGYATRSAARMSVTAVTYRDSWEPSRFGDSSLAVGVGTLAHGGPGRWFVSAYRRFCPCSPPHRSRRDWQVCCEAGGEMLAARSPRSAHAAAGDPVCHRLLGSFSDSLPASWSAGSSSGEGVIADTPSRIVGASAGAAVVTLAYHTTFRSFRNGRACFAGVRWKLGVMRYAAGNSRYSTGRRWKGCAARAM